MTVLITTKCTGISAENLMYQPPANQKVLPSHGMGIASMNDKPIRNDDNHPDYMCISVKDYYKMYVVKNIVTCVFIFFFKQRKFLGKYQW